MVRCNLPHSREKICDGGSSNGVCRKARLCLAKPPKTEKMILLPIYMGEGRTSRIQINNTPTEIEAEWLLAAAVLELENKITLPDAKAKGKRNWQGQNFKMTIRAEPLALEEILETTQVEEMKLIVIFEGRKPNCFGCG